MTEQLHFEGLVFDAALRFAWTDRGEQVKLTRRERDLMRRFLASPGQVLTREQLLDTFGAGGEDAFDRNIDYAVHRLRQKLGDRARQPRFIETLYGEGYIWVARPIERGAGHVLLLLGGIAADEQRPHLSDDILRPLAAGFSKEFGDNVLLRPHWRYPEESGHAVSYALGADFLTVGDIVHVALVLRHVPTNEIIDTFRLSAVSGRLEEPEIARIAGAVRDAVWSHIAKPFGLAATPYDPPLELRLVEAAMMFAPAGSVWDETIKRLGHVPGQPAERPELDLLLGLGIMCRLVLGDEGHYATMDEWRLAEEEMEALALRALPKVQHDPMLVLAVSRLLHFCHRGHLALAEDLARQSFASGTAFGAASVMLGLVHMARGAVDEALECFDHAMERATEGELLWRFIAVLQCTAMIAAGQRQALDRIATDLFRRSPETRGQIGIFLFDPDTPVRSAELAAALAQIDLGRARRLVVYLYMVYARHFVLPEQRQRVMEGLLVFLGARYSPAELCVDLPEEDAAMFVRFIEARRPGFALARPAGATAGSVSG